MVTVRRITIWRCEVDDRAGALAEVLEPLTAAKTDLDVVIGYKIPGGRDRAVIEVWPISGRRLSEAAEGVGLQPSPTPTLLVTGGNRKGLGHAVARSLGDAGINVSFLVAQVVGGRYSAVFGFPDEAIADRAAAIIRVAARERRL
jgi:hypothetical protein